MPVQLSFVASARVNVLGKDYVHFIGFCANMPSFLSIVELFDVTENRYDSNSRFHIHRSKMQSM